MKKVYPLIIILLFITRLIVFADNPSIAYRSDIMVYIDYTPIDSYVINGYTYVPVDLLSQYGFKVMLNDNGQRVDISRVKFATPMYTKDMWENDASEKVPALIIENDIKVYLDGTLANTYFADGTVLLMIDELQKYGTVEWNNYEKTVQVQIFRDELQNELNNADNVIEENVESKSFDSVTYTGQVDENKKYSGIGLLKYHRALDDIMYLGYFDNGKPNGLIYKQTFHTVTKSYAGRYINFIGTVDGSVEAERIYDNSNGYTILMKKPNFGQIILPKMEIPEWTGPETLPDRTLYTQGCYYEYGFKKNDKYQYRIWCNDSNIQTIEDRKLSNEGQSVYSYSDDKSYMDKNKISITNFYEYIAGIKTFYNGSVTTISGVGTENDPIVLNDTAVGGGFYPHNISININKKDANLSKKPIMENDRVLVPMRELFEKLGADVSWNEETQTVTATKYNNVIIFTIGNNVMSVNGNEINTDIAPIIKYESTFVPVRAISESFGAEVLWDDNIKQVNIIVK